MPFLLLAQGHSIGIFIGGASEAALATCPDSAELILTKRRGFVELALEHGASLVPVYTFGDTVSLHVEPWDVLGVGSVFSKACKRLTGIYMPSGMWPRRRMCACVTVVGKPIAVRKLGTGGATKAAVDEAHARYVAALKELYKRHVGELGGPGAAREIHVVE